MGDTLFGSEKSGTPIETRGGVAATGDALQRSVERGEFDPFSRSRMEAIMSVLGFNPADIGLGDAASRSLADPRDRTAGLFAALEPFEERQRENLRQSQSAVGGRFGRNAVFGESVLSGEFARSREQSLLEADAQQTQAMSALFNALLGGGQLGQQGVDALLRFFTPGTPNFQQGIAGDLIGAAGTIGGSFAGIPSAPVPVPGGLDNG
jgi:hypothetical protein